MSFNIFAGARRIALLLAAGIVGTTILVAATERPFASRTYFTNDPNPFRQSLTRVAGCNPPWEFEFGEVTTPSGYVVSITMCAATREKAQSLLQSVHRRITAEDFRMIESEARASLREQRLEDAKVGSIALAVLLGLTWAIGWIVRGFLGIQRGMDRRPEAPPGGSDGVR